MRAARSLTMHRANEQGHRHTDNSVLERQVVVQHTSAVHNRLLQPPSITGGYAGGRGTYSIS